MKPTKRLFRVVLTLLLAAGLLIAGAACKSDEKYLAGIWELQTIGNAQLGGQQQYFLPVSVQILPDRRVFLYDSYLGDYVIDRNQFLFTSEDGTMDMAGVFSLEFTADGTMLTLIRDDQDTSYILKKTASIVKGKPGNNTAAQGD